MRSKLVIDADPGIGDAIAIALALFDPDLDLLAVTATTGCISGPQATRNLEAIIAALDPPKWPRLGSSSRTMPPTDLELLAEAVHPLDMNGKTGLGDWPIPEGGGLHHRHDSEKVLVDIVRTYPNEVSLLTLGPLTNIDRALELEPEFLQKLKGLYCFGGSVQVGGDITAAAEFNIFADAESARKILCSPATKTLIPLDVTRQPVLTFEAFDRLISKRPGTPLTDFLSKLVPWLLRAHHQQLGLEGTRLHEVAALTAIARPELMTARGMVIDIETRGDLTRGMTVFDRRDVANWQTNIDVVQQIDTQGVLDYLAAIVNKAAEV